MREFTTDELERGLQAACDVAAEAPVAILDTSGRRFVLMCFEAYAELKRRPGDPRRVYKTAEMPPEDAAIFIPALEALIAEGDASKSE